MLYTAASNPELVSGLVLLNASGQFDPPPVEGQTTKAPVEETAVQRLFTPLKTYAKKWAIAFAFWQARQPARIKSVLQNVSLSSLSYHRARLLLTHGFPFLS